MGNKITARIEPPEAKGMTFKPKILTFETNKELKWLGYLFFEGLFDGEHYQILSGCSVGDKIVKIPSEDIEDGQKIHAK